MATSKFKISVTGGNNQIYIGDNITVNHDLRNKRQEETNQDDTVISSPKTAVTNCHDLDYSYYARQKLDDEIQKIQKGKLKTLHGPIGTGKTSAALHFINVNKERFGISWFIDVSTDEDSILASLTELAEGLERVSYRQLFQTIKEKAKNEDIIFLLDNVEKKPSSEWFKELWKIRGSVYIIMTTNNASLPLHISDAEEVLVDRFDEAMEFLIKEIRAGNREEDLQNLCDIFGWNILGLTAAKHYMLTTKTSVRDYLEMLRDKEAAVKVRQTELNTHGQILYTSVRACLELIDSDRFAAVSTTSLISHNMIPEFILSNQLSSSNRLVNMADLNDLQDQLKSLVHITEEHGSRFFSFHAFTHYVIRDMIDESTKSDLLYKLVGIFVRYFHKDNRFSKDYFLQRKMREHAELLLREWGDKQKDTRTLIALARLSELVGFAYTQQQPPLQHKLDVHFRHARALLHKVCGITEEDLQPAEGLLNKIFGKLTSFVSGSSLGNFEDEIYEIADSDLVVSLQLFQKLTKKSSELSSSVIEELVFSRTVNKHDFALFPEAVKKNRALKKKIDSSDPLSPSDVRVLVKHGVAYSVEAYRDLYLPELYLSVIYSYGRNYFYKNRATMKQPSFYIDLLKLAYCLSREISKRMKPGEAVFHEYLVQSNGLLYLLVNDDYVCPDDDTCIKKEEEVHVEDLKNAIHRYQQLLDEKRKFFEMGILKKTKDDRYSELICHQQILKCYNSLLSLVEDREQYIKDGAEYCDGLFKLLKMYAAQDVDREDLVRYSRHFNAIAKFYLSINREEYYSRVIKIYTISAEHAEKYDLVLFYVEAVVGLAEVFSRIGKHRFSATQVSIRHLKQCNSKESFREMQRQKPHIQEKIRNIQKQNLASVVTHCAQLRRVEQDGANTTLYFDDSDSCPMDSASSISSTNAEVCEDHLRPTRNKFESGAVDMPGQENLADGALSRERDDKQLRPQQQVAIERKSSSPILPGNSSQDSLRESKPDLMNANTVIRTPQETAMDKHLLTLAHEIPGGWKELAKCLDINDAKIIEISLNHRSDGIVWQAYMMLKHWWTSRDQAAQSWREQLQKALSEIERNDLARDFAGDVLQTPGAVYGHN